MPPTGEDLRVCRIASLTLVNAMIFHQILAERHRQVQPLSRIISGPNVGEALDRAWTIILEEIDYIPIFSLAREIIREITGIPGSDDALRELARSAMRITSRRAALRHDLMGRIYHRLLAEAKYFGAFYTTVPAASLLLKLTLDPSHVDVDWSNIDQIRGLRVADLACGTGTLLKAALHTIVDNHVRGRIAAGETPNIDSVHRVLVEESLYGFDVIPFAIHLAASALAMHEPDVPFGTMNLFTLPLGGGRPVRLGSLEYLSGREIPVQADLYGGPSGPGRITGGGERAEKVAVPNLDLCVMNPPFTRSVGGNLLFGNAPRRQRTRMQTELKNIVRRNVISANITAGLGTAFTALGHRFVKPGGFLALVLPRALLSGVAWDQTRRLIGSHYQVRYVIVSHEPGRWNFSENTELSECLVVAQRFRRDEIPAPTKFINLWRKPATSVEALTVAQLIQRTQGVRLEGALGVEELRTDAQKFGEVILCPAERIQVGNWGTEAAFAQTELCRLAYYLARGGIYVPGRGVIGTFPFVALSALGAVGPDRRDIHDGFRLASAPSAYPAFWGHDTELTQHIAQIPNKYLSPLARAQHGRPYRDPHLLWSRAGRLLIAERLWLDTARVVAVRLNQRSLSNTWWPFAVSTNDGTPAEDVERILALWFNSSLGIISLIGARVDTRGPWVELKKPILEQFPVLNPSSLSARQRGALIRAYDELSEQGLQQLPEINRDPVRNQFDLAIMNALGINDDLRSVREMISTEPLVIGARSR